LKPENCAKLKTLINQDEDQSESVLIDVAIRDALRMSQEFQGLMGDVVKNNKLSRA
jgi:hypothetical protein